ncbi:TetR family transcriptional regulator [Nocardia seriolae]|uniref:NADH dehydrogenase n=1 Tax=Nocardia seriolae TaxID=37332 RepID=A0A0B8NEV8_9NOCA|nr:TetR family transcriptional regulator [Nocardia seriolae]APA99667.1 NADH dehydrogenase [Nocardia seriolae]MTJ64235.1 TetR family transcriptional regulator [Nocardia seriolae]MTJ75275.1 TetR family transcriptional regulator [Nocardia seriolae]MTJ89227.1 TetR family transcriptional regulator [Nocardia seriolae]MTK33205.1 TetR family transcriptional regulator [Nocardia seriolae]
MTAPTGLREREKARVRGELIDAALLLFERRGFEQTTVQEIADAAHVSRRTFHRHFPSKTAVVFAHEEGVLAFLLAALDRRPPHEAVFVALRAALRDFLLDDTESELRRHQADTARRARLVLITNPQLRQENFTGTFGRRDALARSFAHRAGLPEDDWRAQLAATTCFSAFGVGLDRWVAQPDPSVGSLYEILDTTVAALQHGLEIPAAAAEVEP